MTGTDILLALIMVGGGLMLLSMVSITILEWRYLRQRIRAMRERRKERERGWRRKARLRVSEREIERYLARQKGRQLLSEMDHASEALWRRDVLQPERVA